MCVTIAPAGLSPLIDYRKRQGNQTVPVKTEGANVGEFGNGKYQ